MNPRSMADEMATTDPKTNGYLRRGAGSELPDFDPFLVVFVRIRDLPREFEFDLLVDL